MTMNDDKPGPSGELILQVVPEPKDTNSNGDVYAGWLFNYMDQAAAYKAQAISQGRAATVAVESMEFISPIRTGSQVAFYARLVDIGTSSMKIYVEVWTKDRDKGSQRKVTETLFVYVAIDKNGRIREVPSQD